MTFNPNVPDMKEVYEGEFHEGGRTGHGVHQSAAGRVLEGQFRAGKLEGRARVLETDGTEYEGTVRKPRCSVSLVPCVAVDASLSPRWRRCWGGCTTATAA